MQGIRKQQQAIDQPRRFRRQDAGLAAAIRMPAEPNLSRMLLAQLCNLFAKAFAIPRGVARTRGTVRTILSIRQVVTRYLNPVLGESICECDQKRRVAIRSGAVSE